MHSSCPAQPCWHAMLLEICGDLGIQAREAGRISVIGDGSLPSCFPVTDLAVASIAAAALALTCLPWKESSPDTITVDRRLSSLWFGFSLRPRGWNMPAAWDPIAGDYETADGWIRLHTNAPHHRTAALSVLGCEATRDAVSAAVARWPAAQLEISIVAAGGAAAMMRTREDWNSHPQGAAVNAEPLVALVPGEMLKPPTWTSHPKRPLHGIRVLDLTRVLAGPVATRFLAGLGAEVLRVDPPDWEEPGIIPEITLGKRCTRLDLRNGNDRRRFRELLASADVLVHGYRSGALERLGYSDTEREAICPGLIDVSLNAYGHSGPWSTRRGFDSLVQMSTGIAAAGMDWKGAERPFPLPAQALDHATGYLMAAAVIRAIGERLQTGRALKAHLSLARTARLLVSHAVGPLEANIGGASGVDYLDEVEDTAWGPAHRLNSPVRIDALPLRWDRPAAALGTSAAAWNT